MADRSKSSLSRPGLSYSEFPIGPGHHPSAFHHHLIRSESSSARASTIPSPVSSPRREPPPPKPSPSPASTATTPRHARDVRPLGVDLHVVRTNTPTNPSRPDSHTFRFLPRNKLSLSTSACATKAGSVNSTYAYLHHLISIHLLPGSAQQQSTSPPSQTPSPHCEPQEKGKHRKDSNRKIAIHTHPFGCPVNLSNKIVTLLIDPQLWKCAWISSGDAA